MTITLKTIIAALNSSQRRSELCQFSRTQIRLFQGGNGVALIRRETRRIGAESITFDAYCGSSDASLPCILIRKAVYAHVACGTDIQVTRVIDQQRRVIEAKDAA